MIKRRAKKLRWTLPQGATPSSFDLRIMEAEAAGALVPTPDMIKSPEQIEGIRRAGVLNTAVLDAVAAAIHPGMSTAEIDRIVYDYTTAHGGVPACLGYEGFPKSVCTSVNEEVCHGIPSDDVVLRRGDIVNVDCTTILNGYYADASRMFIIGETTTARKQRLVECARECLEIGARAAKPWGYLGEVGRAIEAHARQDRFSVVRDLCGHGVGIDFHEDPEVDHYDTGEQGMLLVPGMVFTIEPMINMGIPDVFVDEEDGWTVVTEDEKPSAQWEHTFLVTETGLEVLTH